VVAATVVPLLPSGLADRALPLGPVPAFFSSAADLGRIPPGAPLAIAPWPTPPADSAMYWQAVAGDRFALYGAYQVVPRADGAPSFGPSPGPCGSALDADETRPAAVPVTAALIAACRAQLATMRPAGIIVGPGSHQRAAVAFLLAVLHSRPLAIGGVYLWWRPLASRTGGRG
jgi:hypothetical protein